MTDPGGVLLALPYLMDDAGRCWEPQPGTRAALKSRATGLPPAVIRPEAPRVVRAKNFQRSRTVAELRAWAGGL